MRILIITVICLALASPASAGLYKWTDTDGKVHYTNDPSQIPLDQRNKKDMKKLSSTPREDAKPSTPAAPKPQPARKKIKALKQQGTGLDTNRVKQLQRLMQKKHYTH
ncbi:MAG: DUF4124 domain-containing protein [Nitrospinae bacterium]|nr:DUF4124 domain-containing protein [Nitrospinota bacterium]